MERDLAASIVACAKDLDRQLGKLDVLVSQIADEGERREYALALGEVIGCIARDFIFRIEGDYPTSILIGSTGRERAMSDDPPIVIGG
jgi:hypothetical protein